MKKVTMLLSLLLSAAMFSCSKESGSNEEQNNLKSAYVKINVSTPSLSSKASDGSVENGTEAESNINSVALLGFDALHGYVAVYSVTDIKTDASGKQYFEQEVAPNVVAFFAVVNPTAEVASTFGSLPRGQSISFDDIEAMVMDAADASADNNFIMVNAGTGTVGGDALEIYTGGDLSTDSENPTLITIKVDRIVAKFECKASTTLVLEDDAADAQLAKVLASKLNTTNKKVNLYSEVILDGLAGNSEYREDPNMRVGEGVDAADLVGVLTENFNWLKNEQDEENFIALGSDVEYVLENTCDPAYHNSNNLTQVVVKAEFTPAADMFESGFVPAAGESWFTVLVVGMGTTYLNFDGVVDMYNNGGLDQSVKDGMDRQLNKILGSSDNHWSDTELTVTKLDEASEYGGYRAATVDAEDYYIQYYRNSINYYDIFIHHDDSIEVGNMGRWGMVRNSSYDLTVTGIKGRGLPFIPDSTDPKIVDPNNTDPEKPEPADKENAYITATVSVNPWTMWYQTAVLE